MRTSSLFSRPRFKLAGAYAGVMGIFLGVIGFALHEAIASSSDYIIERELETLGSLLKDSLEPTLEQPAILKPETIQRFPYLCLIPNNCQLISTEEANKQRPEHDLRGAASLLQREGYTLHLLDLEGNSIATLRGENQQISPLSIDQVWQNIKNSQGRRYRIYTLQLEIANSPAREETWGYLQIGRSYNKLEEYMHLLHLLLLIGLPTSIGVIAITAWWLSGLAMQPIFQSYKQIEQFTADAAHELRTPLAAMRATAEAELSSIQETAPQSNGEPSTIHVLHRQILRLSQMVQDLLLLSKLENQKEIEIQPININELLEDLEEEFLPLILQSKIKFKLDLADIELLVSGNPDSLYRLFMNLIANAIQHTPEAGLVLVKSEVSEAIVSIEVQDSGPGIPTEYQPYIFQRFSRLDLNRSRATGGTGLGLAIALAIAQKHGGDITLTSQFRTGSCFKTMLPRMKKHDFRV